jgi:hypothetical protein
VIIDINMHHLPKDLFSNEQIMNGFLISVPREFGEIAYLGTVESGKKQLILEKPEGYQNLNYVDGGYSLEAKLKAMDDARLAGTRGPGPACLHDTGRQAGLFGHADRSQIPGGAQGRSAET